eukprot:TRINITY_DN10610_c0_g1_i1.p1 TRINITY_DN10610_c0_g1~~TRINITY_DN10610_c0_g1_i1.p1  ORF type:complete len:441 (-),score=112.76 TRINITY_DN10610_c0_g1_i1:228-1550(-)
MSDPEDWSVEDVSSWLSSHGFHNLIEPLVEAHRMDGRGLLSLTQSDCVEIIRIPVLGDVKRLLHAVESIRRRPASFRVSPSNGSVHESAEVVPEAAAAWSLKGLSPERGKALLAFLYALAVSWTTAFVMVIVHDRVPDTNIYPPLPDILLDNIPHIPWAFEMAEVTGMVLLALWMLVLLFHKHRFILARRFFSISGTIFLLRCVTMLITSLSVPGKHLKCSPRPYGDIWNKYRQAYQIWSGAGLTTQGVRTCGDYMFSGHTVGLTLLNFFITEYTSTKIYFLHTFTWICNVFGVFFILAAHEHYSIDVFIAFYISSRLFMYYHTLGNSRSEGSSKKMEKDENRTWFWFPLFSYFEEGVHGQIPNEFEWPLTLEEIGVWLETLSLKSKARKLSDSLANGLAHAVSDEGDKFKSNGIPKSSSVVVSTKNYYRSTNGIKKKKK